MMHFRSAPIALALLALAGCNSSDKTDAPQGGATLAAVPAPAGTSWAARVERTPEGGVRMGNPDAPIKLVEYGSLSCPHCAKLSQDGYYKLSGPYVSSGRVSYEFRSFIIHPQDVPLTLLASCGPVETFFPLIEQVYSNFDAMQAPLEDASVRDKANAALQGPPDRRMKGLADALGYTDFFSSRGISTEQADACLADTAKAQQISEEMQKWTAADNIEATPTLILNGTKLDTAEWEKVDEALKAAGAG